MERQDCQDPGQHADDNAINRADTVHFALEDSRQVKSVCVSGTAGEDGSTAGPKCYTSSCLLHKSGVTAPAT